MLKLNLKEWRLDRRMKSIKGIILAGGRGTRLFPMTKAISKQILPIYDKPLIYYPLSILMLASIKDILIISTPDDIPLFEKLLGDGAQLGMHFEYAVQEEPKGLAEAFIIGEKFIGADNVCLILGDNVFYGQNMSGILKEAKSNINGGVIFGYPVKDPTSFGVVGLDKHGNVLSLEEKPKNPKSHLAIPGLYFYSNDVIDIAKQIKPSKRGELEITEINKMYFKYNKLKTIQLGRGMTWLDTGTPAGMIQASEFVQTIQERQGFYVSCIEEIAWRKGFINKKQLYKLGKEMENTEYGQYLLSL